MALCSSPPLQPTHLHLLSGTDADEYCRLREEFHRGAAKSRKGERLDAFSDGLSRIRNFIQWSLDDRWKRSLVCGVFFLRWSIALNVHHLSLLMGKCKSSINGSIQQLGYFAQPQTLGIDPELLELIPPGYRGGGELRKWTVRRTMDIRREPVPTTPFIVPLPVPARPRIVPKMVRFEADLVQAIPCPIKWRYKFWDVIRRPMSDL
jgi:hypothetical protein